MTAVHNWQNFDLSYFCPPSFIKFDFASIPPATIIDNAKLYLYAMAVTPGGNGVDPHSGSNHTCLISSIADSCISPSFLIVKNQSSVLLTNQAFIAQSVTAIDDTIMDVALPTNDLLTSGNNGFHIRLQIEVIYSSREYAPSRYPDPAKNPQWMVYCHQ